MGVFPKSHWCESIDIFFSLKFNLCKVINIFKKIVEKNRHGMLCDVVTSVDDRSWKHGAHLELGRQGSGLREACENPYEEEGNRGSENGGEVNYRHSEKDRRCRSEMRSVQVVGGSHGDSGEDCAQNRRNPRILNIGHPVRFKLSLGILGYHWS